MILDILCAIILCLASFVIGFLFYFARKEINRALQFSFSLLITMFMGLYISYSLMLDNGYSRTIWSAMLHIALFVGFWCFYDYCYSAAYRLASFYDAEREDYSVKAYFSWRKYLIRHERGLNSRIDDQAKPVVVSNVIIGITVIAFVISLFVLYGNHNISDDYAIEDFAVENVSIEIPKHTIFSGGLPMQEKNFQWQTPAEIKLTGVTVRLATSRSNTLRHYWIIEIKDLSDGNLKKLPQFFADYEMTILDGSRVTVRRSDGQIIE